ncbi:MAG: hypothetical protein EXS37_20945 [Opitutus sp.]|nr:hypothetical protein [Opitutus sp.]
MRLTAVFAFVILRSVLSGAPAEKPPLSHAMMGVANGCFVETVVFLDHWKEANGAEAWARLLQWGARAEEEAVMGHAVAICEARGALWSWDLNHGWAKLPIDPAQREAVEAVAVPVLKKYPRVTAQFPTYRFDFPQPTEAAPPVAQLANPNLMLRDASIVGARLAASRPVNVVRFTYGLGEEKNESAAVVFLFHGRYCVYMPELGTVPFRVRGGVENLRLIQELLRRAFPGATGLRKL